MQLEFGAWICRKHRLCLPLLPWNTLYTDTTVVRGSSLQGCFVLGNLWCSGNVWHVILKQKENKSLMLHLLLLSIRGKLKESGEEARQEASNMLLIMFSHETRSNAIKMNLPIQVFFPPAPKTISIFSACPSHACWSMTVAWERAPWPDPLSIAVRSLISTSRWAKAIHESGLRRDSHAYYTAKRDFLGVFLLFSSTNIWTFLNQDTH